MQNSLPTTLATQVPLLEARAGQALLSRALQPIAAEPDTGPHDGSGSNLWRVGQG
ncbi:MAG: hypothetical protein ACYC23_20755 [Limisphaerales bacterium]